MAKFALCLSHLKLLCHNLSHLAAASGGTKQNFSESGQIFKAICVEARSILTISLTASILGERKLGLKDLHLSKLIHLLKEHGGTQK